MITDEQQNLLAKLDELNRSLQMDSKSVQSLTGLSRKNSVTSEMNVAFTLDDDKISLNSNNFSNSLHDINARHLEKWNNIINNWNQFSRKKSQVKELMKQSSGVPHHYRPLIWQLITGCNEENGNSVQLKAIYPEYLKQQSPCEKAIRRDIARTYPQHDLFKDPNGDGQERLFNIMKAYSIHDREVGYCQGSGFIGGLLLIQMPEEDAFVVLVSLMFEHQLRNLYKPNMSELGLCMYQLDCLVEEQLPKLALHFRSHNFHATVYASGWFLTLFTLSFSIELSSRVMDLFMVEGIDIIFKISLSYLTLFQDELLKLDMESMLRFLQSSGPQQLELDPNPFFDLALQLKLNTRKMKKAEKEYLALKMEEEENHVELRRLRTENGLLLQRIDRLEKECELLNSNYITKNIAYIQQCEEIKILRIDISDAKKKVDNLKQNLNGTEIQLQLAVGQLNGRITEENNKDIIQKRRSVDVSSDLVHQLQSQLVNIRLKEAETNASFRELKEKYRELEEENRRLSKTPTEEVAKLQEDLVAIKLREAETGLSLKESLKRLNELNKLWMNHVDQCHNDLTNVQTDSKKDRHSLYEVKDSTNKDIGILQLSRKLVEAEYASDLNAARQKIMETEARQQIYCRQVSRLDEEIIMLKEKLEDYVVMQKKLRSELKEAERRCIDLETKRKEDLMMWKIQKMEMGSITAELKQKIARMETQREEISMSSRMGHNKNLPPQVEMKQTLSRLENQPLSNKWKDLPRTIMTDSIGPLDEICFNPDDPMITSIYIHPSSSQPKTQCSDIVRMNPDEHCKRSIDLEHSSASSNGYSIDRSILTNRDSQDDSDVDAMS